VAFQVNDSVYVPSLKIGLENEPSALKRVTVAAVSKRSVSVSLPNGAIRTIGSKLAHRNVSVLLIRIGDYSTETGLLDPLAKSLLQFCKLLLPDDQVKLERIRTQEEFCKIWNRDHAVYSHVVLMAHGDGASLQFGDESLSASDIACCLAGAASAPKSFISLACKSGRAAFAKHFSMLAPCHSLLAPFHLCHGATASQFCQTLLAKHFLEGMTIKSAFNNSQEAPGGTSFRYWRNGTMR